MPIKMFKYWDQQTGHKRVLIRHYLDWAATAIEEESSEIPIQGNPSSLHMEGKVARSALEAARADCASVLGVEAENLYFTSGGTESNTILLHSFLFQALSLKNSKAKILYSDIEHPSIRENCLLFNKLSIPTTTIGIEKNGRISTELFSRALAKNEDCRFAAIMGVNNETGAIMDLKELVSIAREQEKKTGLSIHIHADLVQALGKIPLDIKGWDLDSASFSSHKLGGPKGIGLLFMKKKREPLSRGGSQENSFRPGTENISGAIAMAKIMKKRTAAFEAAFEKACRLNNYLIENLNKIKTSYLIPENRKAEDDFYSPWILQAGFRGVPGAVLVRALDKEGIAISTGSACSSSSAQRPVLSAMGLDKSKQLEGIRISQGWTTEKEDLDALFNALNKVLSYL